VQLHHINQVHDVSPNPGTEVYEFTLTDDDGSTVEVTVTIPDFPALASCQLHWPASEVGPQTTISEAQGWSGVTPETQGNDTWDPNWRFGPWSWTIP
jgi:hypothetical protein